MLLKIRICSIKNGNVAEGKLYILNRKASNYTGKKEKKKNHTYKNPKNRWGGKITMKHILLLSYLIYIASHI